MYDWLGSLSVFGFLNRVRVGSRCLPSLARAGPALPHGCRRQHPPVVVLILMLSSTCCSTADEVHARIPYIYLGLHPAAGIAWYALRRNKAVVPTE